MASNDTLFNFDDTLGDREDLTPTPTLASGGAFSAVSPVNSNITQTLNETFPMAVANSTFVMGDEEEVGDKQEKDKIKPGTLSMSLDLAAVRADAYTSALDAVLSPEQQKTFSEDIISVEHVSGSDASGNMDPDGTYTTNTIEMETCISLNKDEEGEAEECDLVEDLEKDQERITDDSESSLEAIVNTTIITKSASEELLSHHDMSEKEEEEVNGTVDSVEQTKLFLAREIDYSRWHKVSSNCVDAAVFHVQIPAVEVNLERLDCIPVKSEDSMCEKLTLDESNNNVTFDLNENRDDLLSVSGKEQAEHYLSGEEDPWVADESRESNGGAGDEEEMVTVFDREWEDKESAEDSDNNAELTDEEEDGQSVDTSDDSSEEFMYVAQPVTSIANGTGGQGSSAAWESHVDQIPIGKKGK